MPSGHTCQAPHQASGTAQVTVQGLCAPAAPLLSLAPPSRSVQAGQSAVFDFWVTSQDSADCSPIAYPLSSVLPSGWSASFSPTSLVLAPGQSLPGTWTVTPPAETTAGDYPVSMNVTSPGGGTASKSATVSVLGPPPLSVSLSLSASSVPRNGTVRFTATVQRGGAPVSGATVTFTVTAPDGKKTSKTMTNDAQGTAQWSYKVPAQAKTGTHIVSTKATSGEQTAQAAPASFVAD